ncbi:MBL fold metallo-hydrolase [Oricola indica]|uniref:MBL fold metallo-hydrolase n=1 Tax=Oricola indica TaxID=2872591 RepID=UPI003CCC29FC
MTNFDTVEASSGGLPRLVLPNLLWTGGCLPLEYRGEVVHGHMGVFLVRGSEKTILIDSGNPLHWEQMETAVEAFLGDRPLDYVFLTHGEFPHAGLMTQWLEKYPRAIAVGDLPEYPLLYPDLAHRIKQVKAGDSLDLGDRSIFFLPAVWRDLDTLWAFDNKDRVLFVSDAFGYLHYHKDGECDRMSSEMPPPDAVMMQFVNERALYWTNHTDVELTFADLDEILQRLKPRLIAPAHGGIVDNAEVTTELFKEGMKTMSAPGRSADAPPADQSAARVQPSSLAEIIPDTLYALGGTILASRSLPWTAPGLEGWDALPVLPFQERREGAVDRWRTCGASSEDLRRPVQPA